MIFGDAHLSHNSLLKFLLLDWCPISQTGATPTSRLSNFTIPDCTRLGHHNVIISEVKLNLQSPNEYSQVHNLITFAFWRATSHCHGVLGNVTDILGYEPKTPSLSPKSSSEKSLITPVETIGDRKLWKGSAAEKRCQMPGDARSCYISFNNSDKKLSLPYVR